MKQYNAETLKIPYFPHYSLCISVPRMVIWSLFVPNFITVAFNLSLIYNSDLMCAVFEDIGDSRWIQESRDVVFMLSHVAHT